MRKSKLTFRRRARSDVSLRALALGAFGVLAFANAAQAQSASAPVNLDLGSVLAQGATTDTDASPNTPGSAANLAPSRASLKETQPTSVVSQQFIQNTLPPSVNYTNIIDITPSGSSVDQSGPGLAESKSVQLRGFQDGQYNVTFDGIPWGDSNDFTHHSTVYFMANDIGQTVVDRGPGTADTIGDATFGGTVSIRSKDPLPLTTITPYGSYGSYDTSLGGAEFDTGAIGYDGASAFFDGEHLQSNTFNQNADIQRTNYFAKVVQPLGPNVVLTAVSMYNQTYQQYSSGGTIAQINQYGPSFGLSSNPLSQNDYAYNTDHYTTDFSYIGLRANLADDWTYDGKIYTYGYYHHSLNGFDALDCGNNACPSVDTIDEGSLAGKIVVPAGTVIPGQYKFNDYRSFGTINRFEKPFSILNLGWTGDLKFGVWYDHQENLRALYDQNFATGGTDFAPAPNTTSTEPVERLMHDSLDTFQPYVQLDLHPVPNLTISPGVKYNYFKRGIDAPVNQKVLSQLGYDAVYTKVLPSLTANYAITPDVSVYAQYAMGFLAPNLNFLYTNIPGQSTVSPETTNNYQAGVVWQSKRFAGDADVYYIPFSNLETSQGSKPNYIFVNGGGAIYEGLEAEGTYTLGYGLAVFANGSLNRAAYAGSHGDEHVAEAPDATAAAGLIFDNQTFNASLIDKWVGGFYGIDNQSVKYNGKTVNVNAAPIKPCNIINASFGIDIHRGPANAAPIKLSLDLDNVLNNEQINDYAGTTAGSQLTYYTVPGRSVFVTLRIPFTL